MAETAVSEQAVVAGDGGAGGRATLNSRRCHDDRGEGVISAAIAVLVMAFLGVGMWAAFDATFNQAAKHVNQQVNCIGRTTSC